MLIEELNRHFSTAAPYASVENVEIKKYHYTDLDKIEIAVPRNGAPLGMFLSGGPDSALTTYLLAKTIQEFGFKNPIYPITTEFLARPYNIKYAWGVLRKIEELNKKVVSYFYNHFDLLDSLFPLTRSCEAEMHETSYFTKDCFEVRHEEKYCWWCRERRWGFEQYRPNDFTNKVKI